MKLSSEAISNLKLKTREPAEVVINIQGGEFKVKVAKTLTPEVQDKMLRQIEFFNEDNISEYGEDIIGLFAIVTTLTDIEWKGNLKEDMDTFLMLAQEGAVNTIMDEVSEGFVKELTAYLNAIQAVSDLRLEENEKGKPQDFKKAKPRAKRIK